MVEKLRTYFVQYKITVFLSIIIILVLGGGLLAFQKLSQRSAVPVEEVDLPFDAEGPYALTFPRADGNALILNLQRTGSYDQISYELAYTSKVDETVVKGSQVSSDTGDNQAGGSIDRGVIGNIDTKEKKGEYEQEILFGTCSKNVCKYDTGVENGTLTLHIKKGNTAYRMSTQWHLQKPDIALGVLTSGDGHFIYTVDAQRPELTNIGFTITNDLTGVPKLPSDKQVIGKVYALNAPIAKNVPGGSISFELAENPPLDAQLYRFNGSASTWEQLDTKIAANKLSARTKGEGIFAVLTAKK